MITLGSLQSGVSPDGVKALAANRRICLLQVSQSSEKARASRPWQAEARAHRGLGLVGSLRLAFGFELLRVDLSIWPYADNLAVLVMPANTIGCTESVDLPEFATQQLKRLLIVQTFLQR